MAKEYAKTFYQSKAWKKCRASYIKSDNGLCERCLTKDKIVFGDIVHHKKNITPRNINDVSITLDHNNLEYLCIDCHNKEHMSGEVTVEGVIFKDGELIETR